VIEKHEFRVIIVINKFRRYLMGIFNFAGIKILEAPVEAIPKCPKCEEDLKEIWIKSKGTGFVKREEIIMCPHCKSFLGFGSFSYS
jgi:hypothetical protein